MQRGRRFAIWVLDSERGTPSPGRHIATNPVAFRAGHCPGCRLFGWRAASEVNGIAGAKGSYRQRSGAALMDTQPLNMQSPKHRRRARRTGEQGVARDQVFDAYTGLPDIDFRLQNLLVLAKKVSRIYEFWNVACLPT
jgi:hypothetical protein